MSSAAAQRRKADRPLRVRVRYTDAGTRILAGTAFSRAGEPEHALLRIEEWDGIDPHGCNCPSCVEGRVIEWRYRQLRTWRSVPTPTLRTIVAGNRVEVLATLERWGIGAAVDAWRNWKRLGRRLPQ